MCNKQLLDEVFVISGIPETLIIWDIKKSNLMIVLLYVVLKKITTMHCAIQSAYHLYRNFGEKRPSNGTDIFLALKTGTGLSNTIYKIPVNFSLSLDMKPGTSSLKNGTENFGRFGKNGKKGIPSKGITFFGMNRSI